MRIKGSLSLKSLQFKAHLGTSRCSGGTQSFMVSSLKSQSNSVTTDHETEVQRQEEPWLRMRWIIVCVVPRVASITSSGFSGTGSPESGLIQPAFRVSGFICVYSRKLSEFTHSECFVSGTVQSADTSPNLIWLPQTICTEGTGTVPLNTWWHWGRRRLSHQQEFTYAITRWIRTQVLAVGDGAILTALLLGMSAFPVGPLKTNTK